MPHNENLPPLRRNIINPNYQYQLGGNPLSEVSDHPYLGEMLSNNMSWHKHIVNITARANRMLGLINRNCDNKL